MTIYCGVGFHARQQTICYCDTVDGLIQCRELHHDNTKAADSQLHLAT